MRDSLPDDAQIIDLDSLIRRVVSARGIDSQTVDDVVQETLSRVLEARRRLDDDALRPYAVVTARNVVASYWRRSNAEHRHLPALVDVREPELPDHAVIRNEERQAMTAALARLTPRDREAIIAHDVMGVENAAIADDFNSTPGAIAARLSRARAALRVDYMLAIHDGNPPTPRCRPVLLALSQGDRRRQLTLDVEGHLFDCHHCATLSDALMERSRTLVGLVPLVRVGVSSDEDMVRARQKGRELATEMGFSKTEATMLATAISEIARNIIVHAGNGEIVFARERERAREGIVVIAKDCGPGIADVSAALQHGRGAKGGLGVGLSGARRLVDDFGIESEVGDGTTVTMKKWKVRRGI